jgi:hypothetical protein
MRRDERTSETGETREEGRGQISDLGLRNADLKSRRQESGDRSQETEGRGQKVDFGFRIAPARLA